MKFIKNADESVTCKCNELTLDELAVLRRREFVESMPVTIHCFEIDQQALSQYLEFIKNLPCLYIKIYVEHLDIESAKLIYQAAMKNKHALKIKMDLGEKILAFVSDYVLNNRECQDIADHLISGVYENLHSLALHYRSIQHRQAEQLVKALWSAAPLQLLIIGLNEVEEAINLYLKDSLALLLIKDCIYSINGIDQLRADSISVMLPEEEPVIVGAEQNCLQQVLTWMWSKVPCATPAIAQESDHVQTQRHHLKRL